MKKILFLLLITVCGYGQTLQNPTFGTVTTKTNIESSTATKISVQETDGKINWLQPVNIPIPIVPTSYTVSSPTLGAHLIGIDNKLGTIVATTAGVTTRVWFTADPTTITAGTFYLTNATSKGTAASAIQSVTNDDNQKKYFTQDLIGQPFTANTTFPPGIYAGNLSASTTPNSAQQRYTVELYRCNNAGTPIASGVTGAVTGSLGVTVITILDSGLMTLADGSVTNVQVSANLGGTGFSILAGERIRYHVSAEKVGTAASNITQSVYYGTSYNSYLDAPVPLNTSAVQNLSAVDGDTTTDALNTLKTGLDTKLNKTYISNYDVADNNSTISSSTFDAFGILVQSLSNKIFMFYREGTGHVTNDGKITMRSSTDGGRTFSVLSTIFQDPGVDCRNIAGGITPTGRIILFFSKATTTGGVTTFSSQGTIYSDDEGLTWSSYIAQTIPSGSSIFSPYGNMITIANGRLALPYYAVTPSGSGTYLKFSDNNGETWSGDVIVGNSLTNGYNEASYAYLDGGVILGVSRKEGTNQLLRQFISIDNGQTWTNQGDIPYPKGTNIAPWLNTYIESNGEKYVSLFFTSKDITPRTIVAVSASKTSVIAGVSGWLSETERIILSTPPSSDYGYTSVINPRQGKKMLGMYFTAATLNPTTTANYTFFNYMPNAVVPAMSGTTNYLQKKTGDASLSDSKIFDNGTNIGFGTNSPNYFQTSFTTGNNYFQLLNTFSGITITDGFVFGTDGAGFVQLINRENGAMQFYTNNIERSRIHASGGVSIGNTTDLGAGTLNVTGNITASPATTANHVVIKSQLDAVVPYKKYVALLSQSGTSAPVATVLENTLGVTITWTRSGVGQYVGTASGTIFTANKTFGIINNGQGGGNGFFRLGASGNTTETIYTYNTSNTQVDSLLSGASVEIRVYP